MERAYKNALDNHSNNQSVVKLILTKVNEWRRNSVTRKELEHLSEHMLNDIGLTRSEADRESARYFWDK